MGKYIVGPVTASGEHRILDEHGRQVGTGRMILDGAEYMGIDKGDRYNLDFVVEWTLHEQQDAA